MCKKTDQAVTLLDTLYLITDTMCKVNAFARVDLREDLDAAQEVIRKAVLGWPGFKNKQWITKCSLQFRAFAEGVPAREFETPTLVAMCERLVTDIEEVAITSTKKELIQPLVPIYKKLHDYVDRDGRNFPAYQSSDKLLDELYRIIEWQH